MEGLTQPTALLKPFAQDGDKNTIPDVNTDTTKPELASLTLGFPSTVSTNPNQGGLPPERKDFNGLGYLTTLYDHFYQCGGTFTFNQDICDAIGGYPIGARLWYYNGTKSLILRSTKNNNEDNFITNPSVIGTSWIPDTVTASQFQVVNALPQNPESDVFYFIKEQQ